MPKAVEAKMTLKDQVTPAIQRMNQKTLIFKKTLRELKIEGRNTWNELKGLSTFVGIGLVAAVGAGIKSGVEFQDQMSQVATLLDGDVKTKLQNMSNQVLQLAKDTGTSTSLLTEGLYQTVSALGDSAQSMGILATATKAAKAGNSTVLDSVNLLSAVMKGYNDISAKSAQHIADLSFVAVKLGQTTFPELAKSMGEVIPLANTLGIKYNELFGVYATLTGVTGDTAEVSTEFRSILEGLLKPEKKMEESLNKLGFANGQVALKTLGLKGTLDALKESVGGSDIAFANLFGRVEAKTAVLSLTGTQAQNFTDKTKAMADSADAMGTAYSRATDTIKNKWDKLVQTINTSMIQGSTTDGFTKDLGSILDAATKTVNFFVNNWTQISPIIYGVVGALVAYKASAMLATIWTALFGEKATFTAIKTAVMGAATMVAAGEMSVLEAAQWGLNAAMDANPIGVVVLIIGALIAAVIYAKNHIQELELIWMKVWNGIIDGTQWAVNKFIDLMNYLARANKYFWDGVAYIGSSIWNSILPAAEKGINWLLKLLSPVSSILKNVGIDIPASISLSGATMTAVKPSWDNSFGVKNVNFGGAKYTDDQIMVQTKKAQEEKDRLNAAHIKALTDNTDATKQNSDATKQNSDATNDNTKAQNGKAVDMTAEQIADKLFPRLERHLYGTT